jgi:hypothetical protein
MEWFKANKMIVIAGVIAVVVLWNYFGGSI